MAVILFGQHDAVTVTAAGDQGGPDHSGEYGYPGRVFDDCRGYFSGRFEHLGSLHNRILGIIPAGHGFVHFGHPARIAGCGFIHPLPGRGLKR